MAAEIDRSCPTRCASPSGPVRRPDALARTRHGDPDALAGEVAYCYPLPLSEAAWGEVARRLRERAVRTRGHALTVYPHSAVERALAAAGMAPTGELDQFGCRTLWLDPDGVVRLVGALLALADAPEVSWDGVVEDHGDPLQLAVGVCETLRIELYTEPGGAR